MVVRRFQLGLKPNDDANDGQEPKYQVDQLTTEWKTLRIPLTNFINDPDYPKTRFKNLYVVCEFVFEPDYPSEVVYFKNINYQ